MAKLDPWLDSTPAEQACLCFYLRRAARTVSRNYDRWLKPCGIRNTQFSLLTAIQQAQCISLQELASGLGMERTGLLRNLKPLQERRLIHVQSEAHSRQHQVQLTQAGVALLAEALPLWQQAQHETAQRIERFGELPPQLLRDLLVTAAHTSE